MDEKQKLIGQLRKALNILENPKSNFIEFQIGQFPIEIDIPSNNIKIRNPVFPIMTLIYHDLFIVEDK